MRDLGSPGVHSALGIMAGLVVGGAPLVFPGTPQIVGYVMFVLAAIILLVTVASVIVGARRKHGIPPPASAAGASSAVNARRERKGVVNKRGAVARLHRPTYGKDLDVGVENEGDLEQFDPKHE